MHEKLKALIRRAGKLDFVPEITVPTVKEFGDYATNAPFFIARHKSITPLEAAKQLADAIWTEAPDMFNKVEAAPPGFVNMHLSAKTLRAELATILKRGEKYGKKTIKNEHISLDYLDANPTGPVHLGHARSGFFGDALARMLKFAGYKVTREFYVNNAKVSTQIRSLGRTALGKGEEYKHTDLLKLLARREVKARLKKIKNEADAGYYLAALIQKENAKFLKEKAKIEFDVFFEEEMIYKKNLASQTLEKLRACGAVYEKDGAVWFKASQYGDSEDRVLVRSDDTPTYLLADIAYHSNRLLTRKYDRVIDIFGADHHGYGPRLKGALWALGIDPKRVEILTAQTVRLMKDGKEFKMSKRSGVFVTLEELIDEVGLDAARWFFLEKSLDTHIDFDLNLAKERSQKNPVYYAQYAAVRAANILKKAKSKMHLMGGALSSKKHILDLLVEEEELDLIKHLIRFPEVISRAAAAREVHSIPKYISELASAFHLFYERRRVLAGKNSLPSNTFSVSLARLLLLKATVIVFENAFGLLGITIPRKM